MLRVNKKAKVKDNKRHNDDLMGIIMAFDHFPFGGPIGHVDFIKTDENGVTAGVTMKKEEPKPQLWLPLDSAEICYDGMGHAVAAIFDADDEALIPFGLKLCEQKHRPSTYERILSTPNFTSYNDMHKQDPAQKRKAREALDWKAANPGLFRTMSVIDIDELKDIQCIVCKAKIQPNAELHYVVKSRGRVSLFGDEVQDMHHDAYDCPLCGSQILLGQRLPKLK